MEEIQTVVLTVPLYPGVYEAVNKKQLGPAEDFSVSWSLTYSYTQVHTRWFHGSQEVWNEAII